MNHLSNIFEKIRKTPGVYIGSKSLTDLAMFISGYECALFETTGERYTFNSQFQTFVQKKQGVEHTSSHWSTLISKNCSDDESFELFYAYLDEFFEVYKE